MIGSRDGTAWVVTNHRTVDDAVNDVNPIAAVAMEYKPNSTTGQTFTKFYVFDRQNLKVNPRTGKLDGPRVTGADLDGGGVKFVPGLCITCHGGLNPSNVSAGQPYPNPGGHVFAHFLPFDLNGFEYSSNPGFTRNAQESVFGQFNQNVLNIETTNPAVYTGFPMRALIELIEGWYGQPYNPSGGTLSGNQNSDFIPPTWGGPGPPSNPSALFYSRVIAHSCRNCHSTRADYVSTPSFASDQEIDNIFFYADLTLGSINLVPSHITTPPNPSLTPLSPYFGVMPHTRRTFERFWLSTSANPLEANGPAPPLPEVFRKCVLDFNGSFCP
jgi:hypothetical protein